MLVCRGWISENEQAPVFYDRSFLSKKGIKQMSRKLKYQEYKGCKDILTIDLHNDYSVIAIKYCNEKENKYYVEFRITENSVDKWDLIQKLESVEFCTNYRIINKAILKYVSTLLEEDFFEYYIERYEYEMNCFAIGNEIEEERRINGSD